MHAFSKFIFTVCFITAIASSLLGLWNHAWYGGMGLVLTFTFAIALLPLYFPNTRLEPSTSKSQEKRAA